MKDTDLTAILLDWSTAFLRLSLHDFSRFTRSSGLSLAQMTVLMHLYYQDSSEVTSFCDMMQISPAGASQMIERMVQMGVVQRKEVPGDRRVRVVSLTEQGRKLVQESIHAREAWIEQLIESLPIEEHEGIAAALQLLNRQARKIEAHLA